ncbi:serine protease [Corallococcus sp. AB030]|uniref:S1C family serine protease n=1 Tax=Corallococcus TaxID=83461 RepID=UPI000EA05DCC|nr:MULTISPECIES: S1C family serine protease [Corallococcus]NRD52723.1 serine protease [Corallococcus exiguus]RKH27564.1 serine protease [Corallococcus sp. CA041A]RKI18617.1 serine protease [Corallococcus sp. AB030]RUO93351.1 serine protease [Corallococcus sp. AB018]
MVGWMVGLSVVAVSLTAAGAEAPSTTPPPTEAPAEESPPPAPYCEGEYADSYAALSPKARAFEQAMKKKYTYCVRSTAVYECLSYGAEGNVRRTRTPVSAHGTAFAYKQQAGETLLLTNEHVVEWPDVTSDARPVDGVPSGCKRVKDGLSIVENEADHYDRDDVPLSKAVVDPQLDLAVIKSKTPLTVMPWKVGRSAAVRERDVVDVRGFPLGVFNATNMGKVISAYDRDEYKEWYHDDFVIDALLSQGNSGSPVLAISCKTGEFELVGVYHAGYSRGSALNVVVGIDQARDLMNNLRRTPKRAMEDTTPLDALARARVAKRAEVSATPFFPFGSRTAAVFPRADGTLLFALYEQDFPRRVHPLLVMEDVPLASADEGFGKVGRVWFGGERGLLERPRAEQDAELQQQLARLLDALRRDATLAFSYQDSLPGSDESRQTFDTSARLGKTLERTIVAHREMSDAAAELADRFAPDITEPATRTESVLKNPPPPGIHLGLTGEPEGQPSTGAPPRDSGARQPAKSTQGKGARTPSGK